MIVALVLDLGPWLAAMLAVAAMTLATGALHEDGLADTADSFGGATRERRLEIMRDSRIGSFGAAALFLALALRIGALAALVARADAAAAVAAILIAASLSRTAGLMPLVFLPAGPAGRRCPTRSGSRRGRRSGSRPGSRAPSPSSLGAFAGLPPFGIALMIALSGLRAAPSPALRPVISAGRRATSSGAAQQVAEIAALIGLLTVLAP